MGLSQEIELETRITQTEVYVIVDRANGKKSEKELIIEFDRFRVSFQAALTASSISFTSCDAVDFLPLLYFYTKHSTGAIYPQEVNI